jgi:hypothetical protein
MLYLPVLWYWEKLLVIKSINEMKSTPWKKKSSMVVVQVVFWVEEIISMIK